MSYIQAIAAIILLFPAFYTAHASPSYQETVVVEVFTTTDWEVQREPAAGAEEPHESIDLQVYELDQIQRVETELSHDLPTDPKQSKQIALQRVQQLDERAMAAIQNAAVGFAKAIQYGVTRYPAIVFDGKRVVYGLTDLGAALDRYRTWRVGTPP